MAGEWKQSPVLRGAILAVIVLVGISFFVHRSPPPDATQRALAGNLQVAVGYGAAQEAVKLLGETGGQVVLIFSAAEEKQFPGSPSDAYEHGFVAALVASPRVKLAGHLLGWQRFAQNKNVVMEILSLGTLQAAREKFPEAKVLVSIMGLPALSSEEQKQWLASSPPALIALQDSAQGYGITEEMLKSGVVSVVLRRAQKLPREEPLGAPQELFGKFYKVLTPANPTLPQ